MPELNSVVAGVSMVYPPGPAGAKTGKVLLPLLPQPEGND